MTDVAPNTAETLSFLRKWPAATLQLTAIHVDPVTHEKALIEARSFDKDVDLDDDGAVERWVNERQGKANLYFTVNTLTGPKNSKANKRDVKEVIALHVDIDVEAGEDQDVASNALLERVRGYKFEPSVIISSGGGVQAFWVLQQADRIPINGDVAAAEAAECYTRALEADFGADHCHNVDRIMRLPGTINVPDIKKLAKGRVARLATLVCFDDLKYPLVSFAAAPSKNAPQTLALAPGTPVPPHFVPGNAPARTPKIEREEAQQAFSDVNTLDKLRAKGLADHALLALEFGDNVARLHERQTTIGHRVSEGPFKDYSSVLISIATALLKAGLTYPEAAAVLANPNYAGTKHVQKQKDDAMKWRAVCRAIGKAAQDIFIAEERDRALRAGMPAWVQSECFDRAGLVPRPTMRNAKVAINALGIIFRRDLFHKSTLASYLGEAPQEVAPLIGELSDDVLTMVRSIIADKFDSDLGEKPIYDACRTLALENCFDPVLDLLADAEAAWDGVPRLDKAAVRYWGAEDTPLNGIIMAKHIMACVARARCPGCKYDVMLVLEGPQGTGKSTTIAILAGRENFTDQRVIGANDQQAAERVQGFWMVECADLAGMLRSEIEHVKEFFSRDTDQVRMAYARVVEKLKRRCVFWGTTNNSQYLLDNDNRRFLPLKTGKIDLEALARDRLQLLGEAAARLTKGESYHVPEELWGETKALQETRRIEHPWEDKLRNMPNRIHVHDGDGRQEVKIIFETDEGNGKVEQRVLTSTILTYVLDLHTGSQQQHHSRQIRTMMEALGWERPAGSIRCGRESGRGFRRIADKVAEERPAEKTKAEAPEIPF